MTIEISPQSPDEGEADVRVLPAGGAHVRRLDAVFDGRLVSASAQADPIAVLPVARELRARRVALVALDASHPDGLRTAAARAVRAARGGTVAWALDDWTPLAAGRPGQAPVGGGVLGGSDPGRGKTAGPAPPAERLGV